MESARGTRPAVHRRLPTSHHQGRTTHAVCPSFLLLLGRRCIRSTPQCFPIQQLQFMEDSMFGLSGVTIGVSKTLTARSHLYRKIEYSMPKLGFLRHFLMQASLYIHWAQLSRQSSLFKHTQHFFFLPVSPHSAFTPGSLGIYFPGSSVARLNCS